LTSSDPTRGSPVPRRGAAAAGSRDRGLAAFVDDTLADVTPRSATLALLRFDEYLGLMRATGLDVCPTGVLAGALRAGLARVCRGDSRHPRPTSLPTGPDRD
jgi:hypothetical protein